MLPSSFFYYLLFIYLNKVSRMRLLWRDDETRPFSLWDPCHLISDVYHLRRLPYLTIQRNAGGCLIVDSDTFFFMLTRTANNDASILDYRIYSFGFHNLFLNCIVFTCIPACLGQSSSPKTDLEAHSLFSGCFWDLFSLPSWFLWYSYLCSHD